MKLWLVVRGTLSALLVLAAYPALAEPPPLDAYGDLPAFETAAISPTGAHVAIVGAVKGQRKLMLFDSAMNLVGQSDVGDMKVRGVQWIGDDAALLSYSEIEKLSRLDFTTDQYERVRALIVPLDQARKPQVVFSGTDSIVTAIRGEYGIRQICGEWRGYFGGIQFANSMDAGRYLATTNRTLFEVDLARNDPHKLAGPADNTGSRDWLVDRNGKVAATFEFSEHGGEWRIENARGKAVARGVNLAGHVGLVALGKDGTTVIYSAEDADGEASHWFEVPLTGGAEPAEILADANIDATYVEPSTGQLIGYLDGNERHFFDPAIQQMSDKISRAFRGLQVELVDWTPDFGHVLVHTSGSSDSGSWYLVDLKALKALKAVPLGVDRLQIAAKDVGPISTFAYKAADGLAMDGILTLPPGREAKNLPVVVLPHGGPGAYDEPVFDYWAQAFASRGYAVFQPNFRGSTGHGQSFRRAGDGQWGRKMQSDISDGLAALAAAGIVDPKRACIIGGSYGGYAALAGVTLQQGLYRCVVSVAGVSDVSLMYASEYQESGSSNTVRAARLAELGPRNALDDVSPRRFASRADAPILLIHGKDDTVVPYEQSTKMADALKDAHKPYEFVDLKQEDHWLSHAATRKQMLAAAMAFVQKHNPAD